MLYFYSFLYVFFSSFFMYSSGREAKSILSSNECFLSAYMPYGSSAEVEQPQSNKQKERCFSAPSKSAEQIETPFTLLCQELRNAQLIDYKRFPRIVVTKFYQLIYMPRCTGFDSKATDYNGYGFLHYAAMANDPVILVELLSKRFGCKVDARSNNNSTPLHTAAAVSSLAIVSTLLDNGADLRSKDSSGNTPLHIAVLHDEEPVIGNLVRDREDVVSYMLKYDQRKHEMGSLVNVKNNLGETPLFCAARRRLAECRDLAVRRHNVKMARLLYYFKADLNARNKFGLSIFDVITNQYECAKFKRDLMSRTPLHYAVLQDDLDKVKSIIEINKQKNPRNPSKILNEEDLLGETALFHAVRKKNAQMAAYLLKNGAKKENKRRKKALDVITDSLEQKRFEDNLKKAEKELALQ